MRVAIPNSPTVRSSSVSISTRGEESSAKFSRFACSARYSASSAIIESSYPSNCARSSCERKIVYSFGTYTRETETVRWSSISLASLRASSTGCTFVRNARPNTPSKSASIFCSIALRTMSPRRFPPRIILRRGYRHQRRPSDPGGEHERKRGGARHRENRGDEQQTGHRGDSPAPSCAGVREERGDGGQDGGLDQERRLGAERTDERAEHVDGTRGARDAEPERRRVAGEGKTRAAEARRESGEENGERRLHRAAHRRADRRRRERQQAEQRERPEQRAERGEESAARLAGREREPAGGKERVEQREPERDVPEREHRHGQR